MNTKTISVEELRRNFGAVKKKLPYTDFTITDRGKPIGKLTASPEVRKEQMMKTFGAWKGTNLDDDDLWKEVLKKKSRKKSITL